MMKNRVIQYNSWTEWNISSKIDPTTVLYSGPTIKCPIKEVKDKNKTTKYITVLK